MMAFSALTMMTLSSRSSRAAFNRRSAEAEAKRVTGLDGQGVLSQEQIESRRYAAKAQAAALAELQTRDRRMTITAPVAGRVLEVRGLDAIDGTPVLDIKPVMSGFAPRGEIREPDWAKAIMEAYW